MNYNDIIKTGYYKHILYLKLYYDGNIGVIYYTYSYDGS